MRPNPCEEMRPLLGELLEGSLSADEEACVSAHLKNCAACERELEKERALSRSLTTLRESHPVTTATTEPTDERVQGPACAWDR